MVMQWQLKISDFKDTTVVVAVAKVKSELPDSWQDECYSYH